MIFIINLTISLNLKNRRSTYVFPLGNVMQLRFKYLTLCALSAMLMACGGGGYYGSDSENDSNQAPGGGSNQAPGGGSNQIPGDGTNELPGDGTPETPGTGTPEIPETSIPTTPIGPSTPITSIPATPIGPSTPITSIPATPIGPSTPITSIPATPIGPSTPITSIPATPIGPSTPVKPPFISKYPEPKKDLIESSILGFFDFDKLGDTRQIRNDLNGSFAAMIQFAQDHVVNPNNNEKQYLPRLTTEKDALLLVTPSIEMASVEQLNAEIYLNNALIRTIRLKEPSRISSSDQSNSDSRPRVQFSNRAWTAALNWNEVRPGLAIRVVDPATNKAGDLSAQDIDFAAPGEIVLQNIRLGLLTNPPESTGHYMLLEPERAGTDYFQTIPAARMIVSKYDDLKLDQVMVASGVIYNSVSATTGDVYSGDMRENTAKSTFGVGINLANWGVTSASMQSQQQPQLTQSVIVHHARGKYANGESNHGLSGGNGMLTLIDSVGNEFSHEIGHHYGLGHYPGSVGNNMFWAAHHADSGWGYIAFRNKMRGNLNWGTTDLGDGQNGVPNFLGKYAYGWDAMSGGASASSISRYTHYTGYSAQQKIQPAFDRYVWAKDSPTGYKKWNANLREMQVAQPKVPSSGEVWYNRTDGNYLKPRLFSVPVYTILGGYDPVENKGLIYPAARGNWGNVFDLPQANTSGTAATCWLNVQYSGSSQNIALAPQRLGSNANKFHVNLAQQDKPQAIDLYCKKANEQAIKLSSMVIPVATDVMPPYVSIGKEDGYSALRRIEIPQLEQALLQSKDKDIVNLSPALKLLYDSYRGFKDELSSDAQAEMVRYTQQQIKVYRLNRWVDVYYADLSSGIPEAVDAFHSFVSTLQLDHDVPIAQVSPLKNKTNCLKVEQLAGGNQGIYISGPSSCTGDQSEQWVYDALGKIHSKQALNLCLVNQGNVINLASCDNNQASQIWEMNPASESIRQGNQCFDLEYGKLIDNRARLIRYGCNSGGNQKWTMLNQNNSLILAASNGKNLPLVSKLLAK